MNFTQWKGHAAKKDVARVTYVCGDEYTLIELVLKDIKDILDAPITDYIDVDYSAKFWDMISQVPLDPHVNRLVVVRKAELIQDWEPLYEWYSISRANPKNFLVFVSQQSDGPATFNKGKKVAYLDHIEFIRSKGKFIKCTQPNENDLVIWGKSFGLTEDAAQYLVQRTSLNVNSMYNVLKKVRIWNGSPNPKALALLCDELALDSFTDYLMLRDKAKAHLALTTMTDAEKFYIPVKLDRQLDTIMQISNYVQRRVYAQDIASATGIKIYTIKKLSPLVKDYDIKKIQYCRQLLTMVDSVARQGARTGVWETLISLW